MATKRKPTKPPRRPRKRRETEAERQEREDLELAEELLRQGRKDQPILAAGFKKFLKQLGIKGKPIGAEKLQEMGIKEGLDPNDNQFSRGIIEMREE